MASGFKYSTYYRKHLLFILIAVFTCFNFTIAQNAIVTENALPGNPSSEWDIIGAGDLSIQGFATDISVNKGQTIHFKIKSDAAYTIDIYRLGYYNGNGARKVGTGTITASLPQTQPPVFTDAATGLVDCGTWNESAIWNVPASAVSGIYIAKLIRTVDNESSHIVFIVRDDASHSDLFFQASDATWQAYNVYGGGSLYTGTTALPAGHASKVSYNRPFITRDGGGGGGTAADWLFNAEYPMIRFLEKNGYNVTYTTNTDAARFGSLILNHKVFLSVGHDEYWSAEQRANVEAARNAGVHLAFFSGNEVYWKTRWEKSSDGTNTPYRTLVCYKEGTLGENVCGGKCDPSAVWTGLWRDGAVYDAGKPENALTGTISWENTTAAIQVPVDYKALRFWRYTSVAALTSGSVTFPNGTLGHEWSPEQFPETYPPGRITLSRTNVAGKIHKLSLYRHSSGALVFGAGTIQWTWGLDDNHDNGGNLPPSKDMQQATVNLLADMGVQPATMQSDLTATSQSTDIQAPVSVITSPAHDATVNIAGTVTISGTASDAGGGVLVGVEISIDGGPWQPVTGTTNWSYIWTPSGSGEVSIRVRGFDDSGNMEAPGSIGSANSITLNLIGSVPNSYTVFQPTDVPANVAAQDNNGPIEVGMKFRVTQNGNITALRYYKGAGSGTRTGHIWSTSGTKLAEVTFPTTAGSGWQQALLSTPLTIVAGTTYIVSYHSASGDYVITNPYFTQATVNGPVRGLTNGEDGPNGLYIYSTPFALPVNNFQTSNYWADIVFEPDAGPDVTAPTILFTSPAHASINISINTILAATFNEDIDASSVTSSSFELRNSADALIPATISYNAGTRTATLTPLSPLLSSATYTATIKTGAAGVKDEAGNIIESDNSWTFTTAAAPVVLPTEGAGGPILVISSASNPFSRYPVEILKAEGLNGFAAADISAVNASMLNNYDVIVLGEMTVTPSQVTLFTNWVNAGGTLIAFKPSALLTPLLGLSSASGTLADKYLLVNTAGGPGSGIVGETIQYHGEANLHTLNGATVLATLYSDATTATTNPAVTTMNVGTNGGKAIAFTYDLAKSIIYTRQGNPAWAGQKRDGTDGPIRSDDMFYPGWIDFNKIAIPQADEQQRLLANIILQSNLHRKPLPRFWYLPRDLKAAIVMTGDDHATGGTVGRFNQYLTLGPNTPQAVANWTAVRGTSYIYPNTPITDGELSAFQAQGFEIALHGMTGPEVGGCVDFTQTSLANDLGLELNAYTAAFPSSLSPKTNRTHCMPWSDWASHAKVEASLGIRLDVNYYYWPGAWVQNRPGMFTGSGMPMRFADTDGSMIDCYQAPTQMTDESEISIGAFTDALLDKALGQEGYYGVFTANMHTDTADHTGSNAIIASALARDVPVISARQMLNWLDSRNNSSFGDITWNNNQLSFSITAYSGAVNLRAMLPLFSVDGRLTAITTNNNSISFTTQIIKGIEYAFFDVAAGTNLYTAYYTVDNSVPVITNVAAVANANGTATITWTTSEPTDSRIDYGIAAGNLNLNKFNGSSVINHTVTLTDLAPLTIYYFRVTSKDLLNNTVTEPIVANAPLSFAMPEYPCVNDQVTADFDQGTVDANTKVAQEGNGSVILKPIVNQEFSGATVPAGWSQAAFDPTGVTSVSGGSITLNGTHAYSAATYGPGTSIEFIATFSSGNFQNIGFTTDQEFNATPWITIGRTNVPGELSARANDGINGTISINLGAGLLGSPHRYRINWNAGNFQFFVDGNPVPAATINLAVASNMYLQISDFDHLDASLSVDWLRVAPYAASGTYTSRVFNAGSSRPWGGVIWNSDVPSGTTLGISVRTGNTPTPDGTWSAYTAVGTSGTAVGSTSQYIQYKADLATSDTRITPVLKDILIECSSPPAITLHPVPQAVCDGASVSLTTAAIGFPVPTVHWEESTNGTVWTAVSGATDDTLTFTTTASQNNRQYRAVWTNGAATINSNPATLTVKPIPSAPTVTVANNCGNSTITASDFTGTLLWSNAATTTAITVTDAATYSVTQTVNGCISPAGSGTSAPKIIPTAPSVAVVNNCGNSLLTAGNFAGTLLWSNGATTASTSVSVPGTYTVTQTVNGCTSPNGSGVAAPKDIPVAPIVTVVNNCGNSVLTASGFTGSLLWSTGQTTSSITVTNAATYTVTQTINSCTSNPGSGTSAPKAFPVAPSVAVANNCGSSVLTASGFTGTLLWSTGATTPAITVTNGASYTVTQTVNGCASVPGSATAAPKVIPGAPTVTVVNNCGNSVLTASNFTGSLLWSNASTNSSITVTNAATYTVTQTINGCTGAAGTGSSVPKIIPAAPVVSPFNTCGSSVLTATAYTGSLLWSNGATSASITLTTPGTYTVTQTTANGCISPSASGTVGPIVTPQVPVITTVNNCGNSVLTASNYTGALLWNTGETTPSITVTAAGSYTVTQTINGCTSPRIETRGGRAAPKAVPSAPVVSVVNNCGSSLVKALNYTGSLLWSTGQTTQTITVTTAGTYTVTQTGSNGCVSPAGSGVATPKIIPSAPAVSVTNNCANSTLTASGFTGTLLWSTGATTPSITVTAGGTYSVTQTTANGCISPAGSGTATPKIIPAAPVVTALGPTTFCNGGSVILISNKTTGNLWSTGATTQSILVTTPGTYTTTYTAENGCTSVSSNSIVVTVGTATISTTNLTICSNLLPYTWNSQVFNGAGTYSVHLTNAAGCDSLAVLILNVKNTSSSTTNVTICSNLLPYSWNGHSYTEAGAYTVNGFTNAVGCDSSAILVLTVKATTSSVTNVARCSNQLPYIWNGNSYTLPGSYIITGFTNAAGCDSTATLVLTVNATTSSSTAVTVCSSQLPYSWNGTDYNASGSYSITLPNAAGCDSVATLVLTVNPTPAVPTITASGSTAICQGGSVTLTSSEATGNLWSTGETTQSIIVTAIGSYTVTYTAANGCTSVASAPTVITLSNPPVVAPITGTTTICLTATTQLASVTPGGVWTSSNEAVATVDASGLVTSVAGGTTTISYAVTNDCGTTTVTTLVTINTVPVVAPITGTTTICLAGTTQLASATTGGVWTSSNEAVATVSVDGLVTSLTTGTTTISYAVTNGCGTTTVTALVTINTVPVVAPITGTTTICLTATTQLASVTAGGVWTSSNEAVATVDASGLVTSVATGTTTISYAVTNDCGTTTVTTLVTVNTVPVVAPITGTTTICLAGTTQLASATTGGVWTSSNEAVATVNASGLVTSLTTGTTTISYAVTNDCGTTTVTTLITVNTVPVVAPITGTTTICLPATTQLASITPGGVWTSSNEAVATVDASGLVTSLTTGTTTISYAVTNDCGTTTVTTPVTVNTVPVVAPITGTTTICLPATTQLASITAGGVWTSSNEAVATVDASGLVTSVATGITTISYAVTNDCGTTTVTTLITVNTIPIVAPITGTTTICLTSTTQLASVTTGGVWTSSNEAVATVNASGLVTSLTTGTTTISYAVTNGCGTTTVTTLVTVNTVPVVAPITGTTTICLTATTQLASITTGGVWTSSNEAVATVDASGLVTSLTTGTTTISYAVTNDCGTTTVTTLVTINTVPVVAPITGTNTICLNSTSQLASATAGGIWTSSDEAVATVNASGLVTSHAAGTATISYAVTNDCGTTTVTTLVTVNTVPVVAPITGTTTICLAGTTQLASATTGGLWTSSNEAVATVDASGLVTSLTTGTATISYAVTAACGTTTVTTLVTINTVPVVAPITGTTTICLAGTTQLASATTGGVWTSSNEAVATVDASGLVTSLTTGTTTIGYAVTNDCGTTTVITLVTVNTVPVVAPITGTTTICLTATTQLASVTAGGVWTSSNEAVATVDASGLVTSVATGTTTISYAVTNDCGTTTVTTLVTVNTVPVVAPITGTTTICLNSTTQLASVTTGGVWTSSNEAVATVDASGLVTSVATGTTTISYAVTNDCGTTTVTTLVTINTVPVVAPITGTTTICLGSTTQLASVTTGGVWTSSNEAVATVDASGLVTSVATGTTTISYAVTNDCGTTTVTTLVTVNTVPVVAPITGTTTICLAGTTQLASVTTGGVWTSSNEAVATVDASGLVTSLTTGTTTISYAVTNGCGTTTVTTLVTVNTVPVVAPITGTSTICLSSTTQLASVTAGGVWTSSNEAVATVDASGLVTSLTTGTTTISYAVTNDCGTTTVTTLVTINTVPVVAPITGTNTICLNSTSQLASATAGGIWTSSDEAVATVNASGLVTSHAAGTATISYAVTNDCGTTTVTTLVTVNTVPVVAPITGTTTICLAGTTQLASATTGGVWTSSNEAVATVDASGLVTSLTTGTTTISYAVTAACGTTTVTTLVTVNTVPAVAPITGTTTICLPATTQLASLTTGGVWTSSNEAVATVDASGLVTSVATGTTTISYAVTNDCGTTTVTTLVTVNTVPVVAPITGTTTICLAATTQLTSVTTGGAWTSSDEAVATVDADGLVTSVATGTTTISYAVTNSCGTTTVTILVTVNTVPVVAPITGTATICLNSTTQLASVTAGGVWTSSDEAVATVDADGLVTSLATGTTTISYAVTNSCGTTTVTTLVTVNTVPVVAPITGTTTICLAGTTQLASATTGGVWTSSNETVATVDADGLVTSLATGTTTISYAVTNGCGTTTVTTLVTVNTVPVVAPITGTTTICLAGTTQLASATTGGVWTSSDEAVATIDADGLATSVATGTTTISYAVTNGCGTTTVTTLVTVNTVPVVAPITGTTTICNGSTTQLANVTTGGVWTSSNEAVATVDVDGLVTSLTTGTTTISYAVTNGCGTTTVTTLVTVNTVPVVAPITGTTTICLAGTTQLASATTGGAWTSSDEAVATVDADGLVTSLTTGTTTISYAVTNGCGITTVTTLVTVNTVPVVAPITGTTTICNGSTTQLANVTTGGVWTSSDEAVATVDADGLVTSLTTGTTTISYAVTNGCGTTTVTTLVTVNTVPVVAPITGTTTICLAGTTQLASATTGGVWTSSDEAVATVDVDGLVTSVATGTTTISYAVTNGCGTTTVTTLVTVNTVPVVAPITGTTTICNGSTTQLASVTAGGVWTSSDDAVASVDADGLVTSHATGTATISYAVTNGCGTTTVTTLVTVNTVPVVAPMTGTTTICLAGTTQLASATTGGVWTSSDEAVGTVDADGLVTSHAAGTTTISYAVTNSCGTTTVTTLVTVNTAPVVAPITGTTTICNGSTTQLASVTTGGTWTSSDEAVATVDADGLVTSHTSGTTTISYAVTNGCGTTTVTTLITVNTVPVVAPITGTTTICNGSTTQLANVTTGGIWTSSNEAVATVDANGLVTSLTTGTTTISYAVTNGCGTTTVTTLVTINTVPVVAPITGTTTICNGSATQLASATTGGVWISNDDAVATADANGLVTSHTAGTATISYAVTNGCGTTTVTTLVTVNATPSAPTISAGSATTFCQGNNVTLTSSQTSGILWSNGATTAAITVNASGNYTVTYTSGNGCSATSAPTTVTVNPIPQLTSDLIWVAFDNTPIGYVPTSNVANTSFAWTRTVPTGLTLVTAGNGIGNINEEFHNTTTETIDILYHFVLTANGCSSDTTVTVPLSLPAARIATKPVTTTTTESIAILSKIDVTASPNPTTGSFNLVVKGDVNKENTFSIRVVDMTGLVVEKHDKIATGTPIRLGNTWAAGIYFIEVTQGRQRSVVRMVKTN